MTYLIATSTFLDRTDNQPVIAGATVVAPEAAVVRLHPERFHPIERGNLGMPGGGLERVAVEPGQPGGDQASLLGRRPGGRGRGSAVRPVPARADGDWTEVVRHPLDRTIRTRGEVYLSDPWEATAAVHNAGYPHPAPAQ